ncbi:hypothetical protein FSB73_13420 [Arachidicoccus ginsenosidivorans]|uniref:RHS repeat-associated core domain-containing protein n=1 Tax=Arachidicoccus ginsenosidivorans TaxID=496057 RepID=A0A5B8VLX1_9BACT|nr:hypothetical protein [Arachidicoccus ginsenosidivorans]QEC72527.1 hypothetical protein FSB73_13420 [Arachidicoccus ginsenosidivorans]
MRFHSYLQIASTSTHPHAITPSQIMASSTQVSTKGLVTWTKTRILDSIATAYITTCQIYDNKGRIIQTKQSNITGGVNVLYQSACYTSGPS